MTNREPWRVSTKNGLDSESWKYLVEVFLTEALNRPPKSLESIGY